VTLGSYTANVSEWSAVCEESTIHVTDVEHVLQYVHKRSVQNRSSSP